MDESKTISIPVPVRDHKFEVVQHIVNLATEAHDRLLAAISYDMHRSLRNARGMEKGFYIDPNRSNDLMKAIKKVTGPKVKKVSAPKVKSAKAKAERKAVSKPGSRGASEWYRDKHGVVRYGVRPTERGSKPMSKDDFDEWMKTTAPFFNFVLSNEMIDALEHIGVSEDDVNLVGSVGAHLADMHSGQTIEEAFAESFTVADFGGKGDPAKKFAELQAKMSMASQDPDVQKALRGMADAEQKDAARLLKEIESTHSGTKTALKEWLKSGSTDAAKGLVATAKRMGVLYDINAKWDIPKKLRKQMGDDVAWKNLLGTTWSDMPKNTDWIHVSDSMTDAQLVTLAFACKYASWRWESLDPDVAKGMLFQAGEYLKTLHARSDKTTPKDLKDKTEAMIDRAVKEVKDYSNKVGGRAVGAIISDRDLAEQVMKGEASDADMKRMRETDEEHATRVKEALAAQSDSHAIKQSKAFIKSGKKPFEFQQKAINWMLKIKRGVNAFDTATGKTMQCIAMVDHLLETQKDKADGRGIIFMPPALIHQWPDEIQNFRPGSETRVIDAEDASIGYEERVRTLKAINDGDLKADFMLMSSGLLKLTKERKVAIQKKMGIEFDDDDNISAGGQGEDGGMSIEQEAEFRGMLKDDPLIRELARLKGAAFFDEAHQLGLKNPNNITHAITKHILGEREHAFGLTATPITNTPDDLYHLMELFHPGSAGGSLQRFKGKIGVWGRNKDTGALEQVGYKDLHELNKDVRPYVHARLKTEPDIAKQLNIPKAHEHTLAVHLYPEQKVFYDKYRDELINAAASGGKDYSDNEGKRSEALMKVHQMRQMAISPKLLDPSYTGRSIKFDLVKEEFRKHFSNPKNIDHPIIVFCSYPSAFKALKEEMMKDLGLDESVFGEISSDSKDNRQLVVEATNRGMKKVLFAGVQSGGAGINLQGVDVPDKKAPGGKRHVGPSNVMFLDKPWSPFLAEQARGRAVRPKQTEEVKLTHMRTLDTFDDDLLEKLHPKVEAARGILYAHIGENELVEITNQTTAQIIHEWVSGGKTKNPTFDDMDKDTQKGTLDAIAGILGHDPKWKSSDQALADIFHVDLNSPEWKKKQAQIAKMSVAHMKKIVFDGGGLKKKLKEESYLKMEGVRIKTRQAVLDLSFKAHEMKPDYYKEKKASLEAAYKTWEAAKKAGPKFNLETYNLGAAAKAAAAPSKGKVGAPKQPAIAPKGHTGWQTKQNPYKKDTDEFALFNRAHKLGAKTKDAFVEKYTARMAKILKNEEGLKGPKFDKELAKEKALAEKTWAKFVKDGHYVGKSMIVPLSEWLGATDAN